jgi:hypothetical protein
VDRFLKNTRKGSSKDAINDLFRSNPLMLKGAIINLNVDLSEANAPKHTKLTVTINGEENCYNCYETQTALLKQWQKELVEQGCTCAFTTGSGKTYGGATRPNPHNLYGEEKTNSQFALILALTVTITVGALFLTQHAKNSKSKAQDQARIKSLLTQPRKSRKSESTPHKP